jgi:hypothetical protein
MSRIAASIQDQQEVVELLEEFEDAVGDEDAEEATEALVELRERHVELRRSEKVAIEQARYARENADDFEEQRRLSEFIKATTRLSLRRGELYLTGGAIVEAPDAVDEDDLEETIERTTDREQAVLGHKRAVADAIESARVPARLVVTEIEGPDPDAELQPGESFDLEVTVANAGDEPIPEATVTVQEPDGVEFDEAEQTTDELGGRAETDVDFEAEAATEGVFDLRVTAATESAGSATEQTRVVVARDGLVERIGEDTPGWLPIAGAGALAGVGAIGAGIYGTVRYLGGRDEEDGTERNG